MINITDLQQLETVIETSSAPLLVDFNATWCGPCKILGPIFEAEIDSNTAVVGATADVDKVVGCAEKYSIRGIPTMILFENGKEVGRLTGAVTAPKLKNWLQIKTEKPIDI